MLKDLIVNLRFGVLKNANTFCSLLFLVIIFTSWKVFSSPLADSLLLESEWQEISRTHLSILTDLSNAVVWMVSTLPLISKSSSPLTNPLVTVPRAPNTIGITITFTFHSFFPSPRKVNVLILLFTFDFTLWSARKAKSTFLQVDYYKVWSFGWD